MEGDIMEKIGLALSGGGAKGAYQVGVIKALEELDLTSSISAISGSSIGALNACLYLQTSTSDMIRLWLNLKWDYVLHLGNREYDLLMDAQNRLNMGQASKLRAATEMVKVAKAIGLPLPRHHFVKVVKHCIDFNAIKYSDIPCYIGCENLRNHRPYYFKLNQQDDDFILKVLLASTAIPIVYRPVVIGQTQYADPMKIENVPLRPLLSEDCDTIIVVNLDVTAHQKIPMTTMIRNKRIIFITPSRVVSPTLQGSLDFSEASIMEQMQLGYEDTMRTLHQIQLDMNSSDETV